MVVLTRNSLGRGPADAKDIDRGVQDVITTGGMVETRLVKIMELVVVKQTIFLNAELLNAYGV